MTLNQLEYFCAVCRYRSITQAAAGLFVTQPTISLAIRELENEFHIKLFNHEKNRISITHEGEEFYKKAEKILRETHEMVDQFSELAQEKRPVRIGIPPIMSTVFFPKLSDLFQEKYDIPVQLYEYGSVRARRLVESEDLDLAVANLEFYNITQFNYHVLMEDHYVYCVSRTHRFAEKQEISFADLAGEKLILFNTDSVENETVSTRCKALGITPNIFMHSSQLYTMLNFIRGGDCGAFLYSSIVTNPRDFVEIPVTPVVNIRFGLIWKKGIFIPARTQRFIDFAKTVDMSLYMPRSQGMEDQQS